MAPPEEAVTERIQERRTPRTSPLLKVLDSSGTRHGPSEDQRGSLLQEMASIVERSRRDAGTVSPVFAPHNSERVEATFSLDQPLALVAELHHQRVDGMHMWIGVQEGAATVLDDAHHAIFSRLRSGSSPAEVRDAVAAELAIAPDDAWQRVSSVIARVARAGLLRDLQGYTDRAKIPSPGRFSRFHLTKACQLECEHCYADSSPHVDRSNEISTERWLRLLNEFADAGGEQVLFTGGEALLHPGCLDLMRVARERGVQVTLFTNGLLVPKHVRDIGRYADQVQVSLDGPDAETNDLVRGRNTYQHILKAIDLLVEQGTSTRIGMTIVPSLWAAWKAHFQQISDRYAHFPHVEFRLNFGIMQYGRGVEVDNRRPENMDYEVASSFMSRINGRDGARITRVTTGCGYAEQLVVGPNGIVYPCHLLDGPVCHIDDHSLPEIIALLRGLNRQTDVDHVEGCRTCEIRYLCGGTCRVLASHATGSRLVTDCTPAKKAQKYQGLAQALARQ